MIPPGTSLKTRQNRELRWDWLDFKRNEPSIYHENTSNIYTILIWSWCIYELKIHIENYYFILTSLKRNCRWKPTQSTKDWEEFLKSLWSFVHMAVNIEANGGDCNAYALIALNAQIMRIVYSSYHPLLIGCPYTMTSSYAKQNKTSSFYFLSPVILYNLNLRCVLQQCVLL